MTVGAIHLGASDVVSRASFLCKLARSGMKVTGNTPQVGISNLDAGSVQIAFTPKDDLVAMVSTLRTRTDGDFVPRTLLKAAPA